MENIKNFKLLQWIFFISFISTIIYIFWSRQFLQPLTTNEIVAFERAKTIDKATDIMIDWSMNNKLEKASQSIMIDYFFIILYTVAIFSGCRYLGRLTQNETLIGASKYFSFLIIFAGLFDIVENLCMQHTLAGKLSAGIIALAYYMATVKFLFAGICLIIIALCFLAFLWNKIFARKKVM